MSAKLIHPEDVKAAIRKASGTIVAFEAQRELPADSVRDVLRGRWRERTTEAVADLMGVDAHSLLSGLILSLKRDNKPGLRPAHRLNAEAR